MELRIRCNRCVEISSLPRFKLSFTFICAKVIFIFCSYALVQFTGSLDPCGFCMNCEVNIRFLWKFCSCN